MLGFHRRISGVNRSLAGQILRPRLAYIRGAGQVGVKELEGWPNRWGQVSSVPQRELKTGACSNARNTMQLRSGLWPEGKVENTWLGNRLEVCLHYH